MSEPIFSINKYTDKTAVVNISGSKKLTTQTIELRPGYSMISTYIDLTTLTSNSTGGGSLDISLIFAELIDGSIVKDYSGNAFVPEYAYNGIGNWVDGVNNLGNYVGLQVVNEADSSIFISLEGNLNYTDNTNSFYGATLAVPALWSIIPWILPYRCNASNVFAEYEDVDMILDDKGRVYSPKTGFNSIGDLIPGRGYLIKAAAPVSLLLNANKYAKGGYANQKRDYISSIYSTQEASETNFTLILKKGVIKSFMDSLPLDEESTRAYLNFLNSFGLMSSLVVKTYIIDNGYRKSFYDFGIKDFLSNLTSKDKTLLGVDFDQFFEEWNSLQNSLKFMDEYHLSLINDSNVITSESNKWSGGSPPEGEVECICNISTANNTSSGDIFYVYLNNNNNKYKMNVTYDLINSIPTSNPGIVYDRGLQIVSSVSINEAFNSIYIK
tara:strand:+ start:9384 stop:10703 length:1320 start_codon:yes stop_codon:yes gene_type:complete